MNHDDSVLQALAMTVVMPAARRFIKDSDISDPHNVSIVALKPAGIVALQIYVMQYLHLIHQVVGIEQIHSLNDWGDPVSQLRAVRLRDEFVLCIQIEPGLQLAAISGRDDGMAQVLEYFAQDEISKQLDGVDIEELTEVADATARRIAHDVRPGATVQLGPRTLQ